MRVMLIALLKRVNPPAEYPTTNQQDLLMAKCDPITSQWPCERATQLLLLLLHQRLYDIIDVDWLPIFYI